MTHLNVDTLGRLALTAEDLASKRVAVLGTSGNGKSNTVRVLVEELIASGVPVLIIDTEGEYFTLKEKYPLVSIIGKGLYSESDIVVNHDNVQDIAKASYLNGLSTVFDLSKVDDEAKGEMLTSYLWELWRQAGTHKIPCVIVIEEAEEWIPQGSKKDSNKIAQMIAKRGRKRGLNTIVVSQRTASVDKNVLTQSDILFLHKVRFDQDMKVYQSLIPRKRSHTHAMVGKLKVGQALVLMGERVIQHQIRMSHTRHIGSTPKLDRVPKNTQLSLLELMGGGG